MLNDIQIEFQSWNLLARTDSESTKNKLVAYALSSNVNYSLFVSQTQFHGIPINSIKTTGGHTTDNFYGFRYKKSDNLVLKNRFYILPSHV